MGTILARRIGPSGRTFGSPPGSGGARPEINVTPLVDVVLVLLIIFMVVTPLLEKELPMRLPEIEERVEVQSRSPDQQDVVVAVTAAGAVTLNGAPMELDQMADRLGPIFRRRPDRVLFFAADDDARYELAIDVLDRARGAGARTIAYLTFALPTPAAPTP